MRENQVVSPIRKHKTLKDRTVEALTEAILGGKIAPGERLNESQLARDLHVSRAPVREALQQLEEQGLIVNLPRRGMYVVSLDEEDIQKINSLRVVLEAEALRLAHGRATPQGVKKLTQLVETMEEMEPTPAAQAVQIDLEFHRTIWGMAGNEFLEKMLTSLTAPVFAHSVLAMIRADRMRLVLDSHRPLLDYVRGVSGTSAEAVIIAHLSVRYRDPARFASLSLPVSGSPPAADTAGRGGR